MKEFAEREKERTEDRKKRREGPEEEGGGVGRARGGPRGRGRRESPRVFGPCLPSSFVPELRLFSWPSFSRFVHPWAQGRARARERERVRVRESDCRREGNGEESAGRRTKSDGGGRGEGGLVETR